ncbi:MAG: S8 family serine peptidase [Candidatus Thermoplasmatota archaeon]|nr:S8 family serine peptidase [Candidatus Thermoplasmatota archaeon]MEC8955351.1 S8 family serine peptidase [Candidatus Thermoplasmatota archaeon]MEC9393459.1 S8 family serine peptidase [Candidatus Thermoplasmatota archaeon]MEC9478083.1 S8 family serine peptidase [Candidatus Thermoplasmatota archaeon]MEE3303968.1 S8 family serine peptidase [Candidatus Thermoplasmatota archaeon]
MSVPDEIRGRLIAFTILGMMLVPALAAAAPTVSNPSQMSTYAEQIGQWWEDTNMDRDGDYIHDAIWIAAENNHYQYLNNYGRISVIVDFDHTPTEYDQEMLEREVEFQTQFRYWLIDSIAGTVELDRIHELLELPGVVFIELDGRLEVQMEDVVPIHGVDLVWQDTGYTGAGVTMAIIDTGIDANHSGLDDLDDDNSTNDTKVLAFFDAVNNPGATNGSEIHPYDDNGHGTHCAGITAGTGAPTFQHVGVAPHANLVGVKVLSGGGSGTYAQVMAGMQWTVEKRHEFNIRAASMSLGGPAVSEWTTSEQESVNRMANEMMRAGVAIFIAAGNSAFSAQIGTPGSAEDAITVGALDKDTAIAVYSSQGPTEEGRIKPNLAFVGSSVNAPDANTGDGYVALSGTSMATPGAAGLGVLMFQANPDLSPFDVKNIMQETSTYRQCHYMLANEPCAEDLIPKNRQNNVYGHGHVNAQPAVEEAANYHYELSMSLNVTLDSEYGVDNRVHIGQGESILFNLAGGVQRVQWRTWDMRDNWMDLAEFTVGDEEFEVTHSLLVDRLRFLPNNTVEGDQVILVRAIAGDQASTNLAVGIHIMGEDKITQSGSGSSLMGLIVGILALLVLVLLATLVFAGLQLRERGFFDSDGNYDEEMDDAVELMMSDKEEAAPDGG